MWTWTAIDAETKLVPWWLVGERTLADAYYFLSDLKARLRDSRIQLTTDGLKNYLNVVNGSWGEDIDFAMLHKIYDRPSDQSNPERKYSPYICTGIDLRIISGNPDLSNVSTSYVERQNLTMRMGMRRFTRLTSGFSKKVEFQAHAVSPNFLYYNFARNHQSLRIKSADGTYTQHTPAMVAGISDHKWSVWEIAELLG